MSYLTIGIAGQLGSGKDTTADYLCERINFGGDHGHWIRKGFANAVKKVYMDTFNVDWEFVEKWKRIPTPPPGFEKTVRESLIFIGDGFRSIMPNIWIEIAFRDLKYHQIISDVRYINEASHIRKEGGFNILMWRPGHENDIQNASEQQVVPYIKKLSERKISHDCVLLMENDMPFDMFIVNDGDVNKLHNKLDKLVIPELQKWVELNHDNSQVVDGR